MKIIIEKNFFLGINFERNIKYLRNIIKKWKT